MKKILIIMMTALAIVGCSNDEIEPVGETSIWYRAKNQSYADKLSATFCFFQEDSYDINSFKYTFTVTPLKVDAEITSTSGALIKPIHISYVSENKNGMGIYNCSPGNYYIVAVIDSKKGGYIWMGKQFSVFNHKETIVQPIFEDQYTNGAIEWKE